MTKLDYTTVESLLEEFNRLPGRIFRFTTGISVAAVWKLVTADVSHTTHTIRLAVRLRVEYEYGSRLVFDICPDGRLLRLAESFAGTRKVVMTTPDVFVVVLPIGQGGSFSYGQSASPTPASVDGSQRNRLDDNLRGVFS